MISFPNCKINLGLHVVNKRTDGFHDIETVFYPVSWSDALEVIEHNDPSKEFDYSQSGLKIDGDLTDNIIYKAWKEIRRFKPLPPLKVHLHKNIPMGAGLGGGSSDAAFFINLINEKLGMGLTMEQRKAVASTLGSDCAFFIQNQPVLATGRGDIFSEITLDLSAYYILVVFPGIHSNTKEAYAGLSPKKPAQALKEVLTKDIRDWKNLLMNDFETTVFKKHDEIRSLKETLYHHDALYASMSGSGSAVYGIFDREPAIPFPSHYRNYLQKPLSKIL
jgi:4-diphosphocytidyl-2-C-methyl-D-erythritol kinase